jgi:predicted nucleic acid-binding protein
VIVSDTNIVSTFARIDAVGILRRHFKGVRLDVTPATFHELRDAVRVGHKFLLPVITAIDEDGDLNLIVLTREEILSTRNLPLSLGAGEAESVAVCRSRKRGRLLTNDKRAKNFCDQNQIPFTDLSGILRDLWYQRTCTKRDVSGLIRAIEQEPGMVVTKKEWIFK